LLELFKQLLEGAWVSLQLFVLTLVFSLPLGFLVALGRRTKSRVLNAILKVYILVMRGTPLMLQLIAVFFLPLMLIPNFPANRFLAAVIAMTINYAAYFAEIFRGGMDAIPRGQHEAAEVLGFTKSQTFFKIIMPQVFKNVLPAVGNEMITLTKDTSLVSVISIVDLLKVAQNAVAFSGQIMPIFAAGAFYLVFNALLTKLLTVAEKKFSYYH
jgi:polar amino acid transport system permease protein